MLAHRFETTIQPGGTVAVHGLPVREGARVHACPLITADHKIRSYPHVTVVPAS